MWSTPTEKGDSRIYVNGQLDGVRPAERCLAERSKPARMWIGGWYNNYNFVGDIDEVRISKVARSADWMRLQYENQKPLQTLVGPLVQPGNRFSVSPPRSPLTKGKRHVLPPGRAAPKRSIGYSNATAGTVVAASIASLTRLTPAACRTTVVRPAVQGDLSRRSQDQGHPDHDQGDHSRADVHSASARRHGMAARRSRSCRRSPTWRRCRRQVPANCTTPGPFPAAP